MSKYFLIFMILASTSVLAESNIGRVCFGQNDSKIGSEHTDRLYIRIDDSDRLYFNQQYFDPVLDNLDLRIDHTVKVYFDDKLGSSWKFNFSKLDTQSVIIWRSAGSWRMKAADETCQ